MSSPSARRQSDHAHRFAPTRRPLAAHAKLDNPLVDFDRLPAEADWWDVDGVICALGTTRAKAGSDQAFRVVDHDYPLEVARLARKHGASRFALNSSVGANARSKLLYPRTKGEVEEALKAMGFQSLTIVRPGLIGGDRDEFRLGEHVAAAVLGIWVRFCRAATGSARRQDRRRIDRGSRDRRAGRSPDRVRRAPRIDRRTSASLLLLSRAASCPRLTRRTTRKIRI